MTGAAAEPFPPPFPPLPPSWVSNAPLPCLGSVAPNSLGTLPPPPVPAPPLTHEYPTLRLIIPTKLVAPALRFQGIEREQADQVVRGILAPEEMDATPLVVRGLTKDDLDSTIYAMLRAFETYNVSGTSRVNDDELHLALKVPHTVAELLTKDCSAKLKELCRGSIGPLKLIVDHVLHRNSTFSEQFIFLTGFHEAFHDVLPVLNSIIQEETPKCIQQAKLAIASVPIRATAAVSQNNSLKKSAEDRGQPPLLVVPEAASAGAVAARAAPWHSPATPWTAEAPKADIDTNQVKSQSKNLARPAYETPLHGAKADTKQDKSQSKNLARPASAVTSDSGRVPSPPKKKAASDGRRKEKRSEKESKNQLRSSESVPPAANSGSVGSSVSGTNAPWHQSPTTQGTPAMYPPTNYAQVPGGPWHVAPPAYGVQQMSPAYSQWARAPMPHDGRAPMPHDGRSVWIPPPRPYNGNGQAPIVATNGAIKKGEQTLKEWLISLDGGHGGLLIYHEALTENFETVEDLTEVERGHDGSVPDNQFFEDLKVTRADHRDIFKHWFMHRLQTRN